MIQTLIVKQKLKFLTDLSFLRSLRNIRSFAVHVYHKGQFKVLQTINNDQGLPTQRGTILSLNMH